MRCQQQQDRHQHRRYLSPNPVTRDKASQDILWCKDDSLVDSDNRPQPDLIAQEILDYLQTAPA